MTCKGIPVILNIAKQMPDLRYEIGYLRFGRSIRIEDITVFDLLVCLTSGKIKRIKIRLGLVSIRFEPGSGSSLRDERKGEFPESAP